VAQLVEHHLAKVRVAGSNPVVRSRRISRAVLRARRWLGVMLLLVGASWLSACGGDPRYDTTIAAASDTRLAFEELARFVKTEQGVNVGFVFGSSGLLREQVINGAPFDVFVSANETFVNDVVATGAGIASSRLTYAEGRLAVISADGVPVPADLSDIASGGRIVIANPAHAPYGVAAHEMLSRLQLYEDLRDELILAENVADAVRIVRSGEVDYGIVALSLVSDEPHLVVPSALHEPIRQSLVVTTRGELNSAARAFIDVLMSPEGRRILAEYGFLVGVP
jgi:molybdate transport system substrate-binding protein